MSLQHIKKVYRFEVPDLILAGRLVPECDTSSGGRITGVGCLE